MTTVFLSYSSADVDFVRRLAEDLRQEGIGVWLDEWEVLVGDDIRIKVEEGIVSHDYVVVVMSRSSMASQWVSQELSAALAREIDQVGKVILPVNLGDLSIPPLLAGRKHADFSDSYERGFAALLAALSQVQISLHLDMGDRALWRAARGPHAMPGSENASA